MVDTADLDLRTVAGPRSRASACVEVGGAHVAADHAVGSPSGRVAAAVAAGQRALGHELVGASRDACSGSPASTRVERIQFGRPIAQFQAVRHRLAEAYVAIEAADAALGAAWDDGTPFTAAMAKAVAGRSARTVSRHCQQVLAGIGFTTEHDLHLLRPARDRARPAARRQPLADPPAGRGPARPPHPALDPAALR